MEDFPICRAKHKKLAVQKLIFSCHMYMLSPPFFQRHPFVTKEVGMKGDLSPFLKAPSLTAEFLHT